MNLLFRVLNIFICCFESFLLFNVFVRSFFFFFAFWNFFVRSLYCVWKLFKFWKLCVCLFRRENWQSWWWEPFSTGTRTMRSPIVNPPGGWLVGWFAWKTATLCLLKHYFAIVMKCVLRYGPSGTISPFKCTTIRYDSIPLRHYGTERLWQSCTLTLFRYGTMALQVTMAIMQYGAVSLRPYPMALKGLW